MIEEEAKKIKKSEMFAFVRIEKKKKWEEWKIKNNKRRDFLWFHDLNSLALL